jgi:cytochrome c556
MTQCVARRLAAGAVFVAVAAGNAVGFAADEPVNIIKYRKAIMGANAGHISALAAMAKNEVSWTDTAELHARAINEMSQHLDRLFPEGTGKGDTEEKSRALPAIWENPDEFQQQIETLQEESAKMIEVAQTDDRAAFAQQVGQLGKQGCGGCHEDFREEED